MKKRITFGITILFLFMALTFVSAQENCNAGLINGQFQDTDGDGCHAGLDSDCGGVEGVDDASVTCYDGIDNDCDGMIDFADNDGVCSLNKIVVKPNETTGEPEHIEDVENSYCYGCLIEDNCYPLGYRLKEEYCAVDKVFVSQVEAEEACNNNFECSSNLCINSQCVSSGVWQKFIRWLSKIFG